MLVLLITVDSLTSIKRIGARLHASPDGDFGGYSAVTAVPPLGNGTYFSSKLVRYQSDLRVV